MLVLLIIFIISLPPVTHAVKIDNPLPPPPNFVPPPPPEIVNLTIDFDGTLGWNGTPVDRPTMQGYIVQESSKDPQPEVHISVDKFAKYEKVAQTLADLQSRGLKKIGFVNNELF
jgi:biopolymer transport protein ExbD